MGVKLLWTGLAIIMAVSILRVPSAEVVGAVIMVIGAVLLWMDK